MANEAAVSKLGKVPFSRKVGYAVGIFSDTLGYTMFYSFFSIFLTTVVGINPALSGVISSIGVLWDGITDPIIGHLADLKPGRKRKFILWGSIPYAISVVLTYVAVDFGPIGSAVYYIFCVLSFWLFYTMVCVPYYASVPEMTDNYDERTSIRNLSATLNTFTNWLVLSTPMLLVTYLTEKTGSAKIGWPLAAAIFAALVIVFAVICSSTLKKAEKERGILEQSKTVEYKKEPLGKMIKDLVHTFAEIFKLKPTKWIVLTILIVNIYRGISSAGFVYYMSYNVGWNAAQIGLAYSVLVLSWLPFFPVISWVCKKWDRRVALIGSFLITGIARYVIYFAGIYDTTFGAYLNIIAGNFLLTTYLALIFAMPYDLAELYEFKNGMRRDSALTSIPLMAQKIGAAVGMLVWGFMLENAKFDATAAVQTDETLHKMAQHFCGTINIFIFVSVVCLLLYKMKKNKVALLQQAVQLKREGKPYSTEGFEDLL